MSEACLFNKFYEIRNILELEYRVNWVAKSGRGMAKNKVICSEHEPNIKKPASGNLKGKTQGYCKMSRCPGESAVMNGGRKGKVRNIFKWHIHVFRCIDVHKGKTLYFICEETKNKGFKKLSRRELLLQSLNNPDLLLRMYGHESRKQNQTKQTS